MKVGILTWYQAINHGAVLQTYASCELLKSINCEPVVLNYNWELYDKNNIVEKVIRRVKYLTPKQVLWHIKVKSFFAKKSTAFQGFINSCLPIGEMYDREPNLGALYIGSDMVFDITQGYNPYMYGANVNSPYKFSYAASFGYTTIPKMERHPHKDTIVSCLRKLDAIGYRDQNTLDICKHFDISSVYKENIDPVLCYGFEREITEWDTGKWKNAKYLLVYSYEINMNKKDTVDCIREYAKKKGLKTISCGYYHQWCDENIAADPKEFLEMFKYAEFIITDTFHGTIFSLLLHKRFATIITNNGFKVRYLLEQARMKDRIIDNILDLSLVLDADIGYECFDQWLKQEQIKSREFISYNIEKAAQRIK